VPFIGKKSSVLEDKAELICSASIVVMMNVDECNCTQIMQKF
jgi:hypothetical protein